MHYQLLKGSISSTLEALSMNVNLLMQVIVGLKLAYNLTNRPSDFEKTLTFISFSSQNTYYF